MVAKELEMKLTVPQSMKAEHDGLHAELEKATKAGGRVGDAAKVVARLLHPHFVKEEEFALPPLHLLVALSQDKIEPEMADVLAMTDKLEGELPRMLAEHKDIVAALEKLIEAAVAEKKPEQARLAEKLVLHARTEEQVSYPAAILIGRYLKLKLGK